MRKFERTQISQHIPSFLPPCLSEVNISFAETRLTVREGVGIVQIRLLKADDTSVPGGRGVVRVRLTTEDGSAIGAPFGRFMLLATPQNRLGVCYLVHSRGLLQGFMNNKSGPQIESSVHTLQSIHLIIHHSHLDCVHSRYTEFIV